MSTFKEQQAALSVAVEELRRSLDDTVICRQLSRLLGWPANRRALKRNAERLEDIEIESNVAWLRSMNPKHNQHA